jgi:hypothetical protein
MRLICAAVATISLSASTATAQAKESEFELTVEPKSPLVCAGKSVTLTAKRNGEAVPVIWSSTPTGAGGAVNGSDGAAAGTTKLSSVTFDASPSRGTVASYGTVAVTAASDPAPSSGQVSSRDTAHAVVTLAGFCENAVGGELTRATLGFEQIGAAGIENALKYSFDFFISRPMPVPRHGAFTPPTTVDEFYFGPRLRWWGDVRTGSYPQQVNTELATAGKEFATNFGKVQVNKLVQTAEFTTGLEVRIASFPSPRQAVTELSQQRFALMLVGGVGAVGPFSPAEVTVFVTPASSSDPLLNTQYAAFHERYPTVNTKFVAFRQETPDRFLGRAVLGLRLYTFYAEQSAGARPLSRAPAFVEVQYGKNRLLSDTQGVWHAAAYYPFALGDRSDPKTLILYFFGDAWMKPGTANSSAPRFELVPAVESEKPVPLSDPRVMIATVPASAANARDTYRIGLSLDLMRVWERLTQPAEKK